MNKNQFRPMLFTSLKSYNKNQLVKDLIAGIIVAIIALPLSIALALASGVGPEEGIYTAIVAGFVISFLGGSTVQIAGPTAAFATIVAGIVAKNGMQGLATATILAGVILVIMGFFKLGSLIRFIPFTITTGFTSGIALTILLGQLKDFCGVTYPAGMETIETADKVKAFFAGIGTFNPHAFIVGAVCLAVLIIMPKISSKIPASLVAVLVGIAMVKLLPLEVNTIGDLYTINSSLPKLTLPSFSLSSIRLALPDAFTIAVLAAIESLLSCVVADGMTGTKHNSNTELVAQGAGNIASALFGGIPATGAIARTAANIKNGGRTPVAGIIHALVLLLVLVFLMPYAALIPMPAIAAILFQVAYNMSHWRTFVSLIKTAPKSDILVLVVTFVLTVVFDLVVAIEVGMLMACVLFMKRMSEESYIKSWKYINESKETSPDSDETISRLMAIPSYIRVYEATGPMFFGAANQIEQIIFKDMTKCLILRMRGVPAIDSTALNSLDALRQRCEKKDITLILSHVNEQPMKAMKKSGFYTAVGSENFCSDINSAIERAKSLYTEHA
ncbi:MAG: STAS domain-containing protein [Ruminococcaceae bacterium]|nr:STAS domain-containing protein [Oscillospiraceae bacterium]